MARETSWYLILVTWLILGMTAVLLGQTTQPATPTTTPTTTSAPAEGAEGVALLVYEVYEVQGQVRVGPTDADPELDEGWRPVQKEDQILAGQKIFVPNKARLKLVARPADPPTVIMLEPNTLINVSELTITNGAAVSRIDLGYGAIRAGVAEGTVRSDMQIRLRG